MQRGVRFAVSTPARVGLRGSILAASRRSYQVLPKTPSVTLSSPFASTVTRITPRFASARFYTSRVVDEPARVVEYNEVKNMVQHPDPNVVLVDVREPSEYENGHIPNAVNIPFKSMPGALGLDSAEFESTLGFPKPDSDKTLLFYCLGGVRSTGSEQIASTYGYRNRMNYKGSYDDWSKQEEAKA